MYVRQLMADFRREYHVSYLDVPTAEAVQLALMLREGSSYLSALDPALAWSNAESLLADIMDGLSRLTHMLSDAHTTEGAQLVARPGQAEAAQAERERAAAVRRYLEETEWEEVDDV